jgi:very-short-patch-repair endonuclease
VSWAPAFGEDRRKDYKRAQARAQRLRRDQTPSERAFWKILRLLNKNEGANFRRQTHVGARVYDFADLGRRILIELDGGVHERAEVQAADKEKAIDALLRGYKVVRFSNDDAWRNQHVVYETLKTLIADNPPLGEGRPRSGRGGGVQDKARAAQRADGATEPNPARPSPTLLRSADPPKGGLVQPDKREAP